MRGETTRSGRVTVMSRSRQVASLQEQCRRSILASISIHRVQQVVRLPLPCVVKDFLTTFRVVDDFDLSGMYIDYNFNFPNHAHHRTHQVHPGVCRLDGTKVLLKCLTEQSCELCGTDQVDFQQTGKEREAWQSLKHKNLQNCLLSDVQNVHGMTIYVLEFPLMSILDYAYKVFLAGNVVPEFLVWETLLKLTSVFLYLEYVKVEAWELCQPEHIIVDDQGEIKLENLLLYLPARNLIKPRRNVGLAFCTPVHHRGANGSVVWGLGNIASQLITPVPSVLIKGKCASVSSHLSDRLQCSRKFHSFLAWCMQANLQPSLGQVHAVAHKMVKKMQPTYTGPRNLLHLVGDCKV